MSRQFLFACTYSLLSLPVLIANDSPGHTWACLFYECWKGRIIPRNHTLFSGVPSTSLLKCAQIGGPLWIFCRPRLNIADLDVDFLYAGPFCAGAEEPTPLSDDACGVKRIARDQKLHALAGA